MGAKEKSLKDRFHWNFSEDYTGFIKDRMQLESVVESEERGNEEQKIPASNQNNIPKVYTPYWLSYPSSQFPRNNYP